MPGPEKVGEVVNHETHERHERGEVVSCKTQIPVRVPLISPLRLQVGMQTKLVSFPFVSFVCFVVTSSSSALNLLFRKLNGVDRSSMMVETNASPTTCEIHGPTVPHGREAF